MEYYGEKASKALLKADTCREAKKTCQILLLDRDKTKNKHYEQTLNFLLNVKAPRSFAIAHLTFLIANIRLFKLLIVRLF